MANPKLSTLVDAFTAPSINSTLWNSVTGGAATLDTVNDLVVLASPTASGTNNSFGSSALWDATSSSIYAEIGTVPNGNGGTKSIFKLTLDANNSVAIRLEAGVFKFTLQTTGTTVTTTLPTYDPSAHGWWRLRESGGTWFADTSADGFTWTTLTSSAYSWAATAMSFGFQTGASVTEVAGNVATIQHVNTMLGGQANVNWPMLEEAWGPFWNANAGTQPLDRYVEVTDRTRNTSSVSRGRQYELDAMRTGEASLTLANTDGQLDPTNSSGQWYGHIQPYQPYRKRAQWPATRNLLDQVIATGGDLGGFSGTISGAATNIFSVTDSSGGSFVTTTSAWQGTSVMQFAVPSGTAGSTRIMYTPRWSPIPGLTYTVQMRARNVTAATSLSVRPFISYYTTVSASTPTYGTPATLTGSATAAWTTFTVSVTIPAGAGGMSCGLALDTTAAAATSSIQIDGIQLEKGATASTWQAPGVWYPMYAGWTERWTPSWNMAGTYGIVQPTCVDTFSLLSQQQLSDPLTEEISSRSPRFVYRLDDPAASVAVTDWTGNNPAAQLGVSKYGAGSMTFGNTITAADATGVYTGSSGTVATVSNSNPGTATIGPATFIKLSSAGILGPADVSLWTRAIAFRYTGPTPTSSAVFWSGFDNQRSGGLPSGSAFYFTIGSDGKVGVVLRGPTSGGGGTVFATGTTVVDSDWHLITFSYSRSAAQIRVGVDGGMTQYSGVASTLEPSGLISDNIGAYVDPTVGSGTYLNFKGDISFAAEFPSYFSSTDISNLYTAWKSSCAGESTDARYARILRYAGYQGWNFLEGGLTTSMGPAAIDGQDAMTALQNVVDTENGSHYVDRAGTITFLSRADRYNATVPMYTFGENTAAGEYPYEDVQLDFDSTHLSNQVTVTQESTGQNSYATDATSITNYFPRSMSRTINSSSALECQDAANYLLSRYKNSAMRVSSLKLHPSANPTLWPILLNLELGTRVRVMRRPPGVTPVQVDCFVENIQWDLDDSGEAWCTLQCSPADLTTYGVFAAWHTTLTSSTLAGVTSITVNASADTTNPLATQLGPGQLLILGQNTANQESVTVSAVGATSPGWTTAVITLTAATTKAHTAGDKVNEPLSGVTDPTTYDAVSKFDSTAFAY